MIMKYIDSDKLKEKINEVRQDWLGDSTGLEVGEEAAELGAAECILDSVDDIINSLQQEAIEKEKARKLEYDESFNSYWRCVIGIISKKRALPTFKGQLLHDFKNELHTMKQIISITNHPEIHEGLFDILALVFATWGGYHFHPQKSDAEDSLNQGRSEISLEKFTDMINTFKARYEYPVSVPVNGAIGFIGRMFDQYPNVAKRWYDGLPKVVMDSEQG